MQRLRPGWRPRTLSGRSRTTAPSRPRRPLAGAVVGWGGCRQGVGVDRRPGRLDGRRRVMRVCRMDVAVGDAAFGAGFSRSPRRTTARADHRGRPRARSRHSPPHGRQRASSPRETRAVRRPAPSVQRSAGVPANGSAGGPFIPVPASELSTASFGTGERTVTKRGSRGQPRHVVRLEPCFVAGAGECGCFTHSLRRRRMGCCVVGQSWRYLNGCAHLRSQRRPAKIVPHW